jgi:iron complex outermembrane receptor protein
MTGGRAVLAACALLPLAAAQAQTMLAGSLADLSLEELSRITVTSVSRREESLAQAAASVYVITAEDIRRSGRNSLPEVLRLAPNLDVARADASQYAITARGFNNVLANKLLVLIDGRTVYTPLFSGTFWEEIDVMLEDVDRIEVISGPGSTLWGANAVNGVINVITRRAAETQGVTASLLSGSAGEEGAARYGGALGAGHYRVYGKTVRRDATAFGNGTPILDAAEQNQAGFRADWGSAASGFTLQGDAYEGQAFQQNREYAGLNLLGRWNRALEGGGALEVQAYYNRANRHHFGLFKEERDTYDLEVQHALAPRGAHRLMWGAGARRHEDRVQNSALVAFLPPDAELDRNHVLLQDEIALARDLELTLGAKLEYNNYTGNEFLPTARIGWRAGEGRFLWAALSRAVRAPSRIDRDAQVGVLRPGEFRSEVVKVAELGWRAQPARRFSYSLTAFRNEYEHLRTLMPNPAGPGFVFANDREGSAYGVEGWATWQVSDRARLSGGFVGQQFDLAVRPGGTDLQPAGSEGNEADYWVKLRAAFDLMPGWELDAFLRHYAVRPNPEVPNYTALDLRVGWRAARDVELSLAVQNLFDRRHPEWGPPANRAEFERGAFLKLRVGI